MFVASIIGLGVIFLFWTGIGVLVLAVISMRILKKHKLVPVALFIIAGLLLAMPIFTGITTRIAYVGDVRSDYVDTGEMVTIRADNSIFYNGKRYVSMESKGLPTGFAFSGKGICLDIPIDEDYVAFNVKHGFNWLTGIPLYVNTKDNAYGTKSEWVDDLGLYNEYHDKEEETMLYGNSDYLWCEDGIEEDLIDFYDESYEGWQWILYDTKKPLDLTREEEREVWEDDHEWKGISMSDEACEDSVDLVMVSRDGIASQSFYAVYSKGEWYTPSRKLSKSLSDKISEAYFDNR